MAAERDYASTIEEVKQIVLDYADAQSWPVVKTSVSAPVRLPSGRPI